LRAVGPRPGRSGPVRRAGEAGGGWPGGREGQEPQLAAEVHITDALGALPLLQVTDPAALCAPGMPPQALAMQAFKRARHAEQRAERAEQRVRQLQGEVEEAWREAAKQAGDLREELGRARRRLDALQREKHSMRS